MIPAVSLATPSEISGIGGFVGSDDWVVEQKVDGHRIRMWTGSSPRFETRNGTEYTKSIPASIRNANIPEGWVLDGELAGGVLWVFDILSTQVPMSGLPLRDRRVILDQVLDAFGNESIKALPQATTTEDKKALVFRVANEGLEGVVAKATDSTYHPGRNRFWYKVKYTATADVIVMSVGDDGKESATLGIKTANGVVEIGRCSLIGKPRVGVGDVVEVKYLYLTEDGRLYQPTLMRVRFDKDPDDCDGSDFRVVSKRVLESL